MSELISRKKIKENVEILKQQLVEIDKKINEALEDGDGYTAEELRLEEAYLQGQLRANEKILNS